MSAPESSSTDVSPLEVSSAIRVSNAKHGVECGGMPLPDTPAPDAKPWQ
ncbi:MULTISPECIES: hypothetical protein [Halomonas]|uniref:Uncharacterized protein n=1 Tax=Halomonas tibetensis TaxID=2259590 RepID=A0ABV7AZ27_9GAMM